jgi:hypothetical protein
MRILLASSSLRRVGGFVVVSLALALVAAPKAGAALAGGYEPNPANGISMPPLPGGTNAGTEQFGTTLVNAGVPGNPDLLLAGVPNVNSGDGAIVFVNPVDGSTRRIQFPTQASHAGTNPTGFGASVALIPDIGKCDPAPGAGKDCRVVSDPSHTPDYLVGAPGADFNSGVGLDMGIVYLFDGATDGVMKRIALVSEQPAAGLPDFGRSVASASGSPPCAGSGGIGGCPALASPAASGDIDGDGLTDVVIGAPSYRETQDSDPAACGTPTPCAPTGRVYVVKGSALAASAVPGTVVDASDGANLVFGAPVPYPYPAETSNPPSFGVALSPLGDLGSCNTGDLAPGTLACPIDHVSNAPDGLPDLLVSGTGADLGGTVDAGAAFVIDGGSGIVLSRLDPPSPAANGGFGAFSSGELAFGDLVDTGLPDIYVGAPGQAQGYVFTGDSTLPLGNRLWASTPLSAGGPGMSSAPTGDIAGDSPGELLIGEGNANAVHVFSACSNAIAQTIGAPGGAGGFGTAVVPVGDVNTDGYPDFAVGAPSTTGGGRVYVMRSNGAPGPGVIPCHPTGGDSGGGGATGTGGGGGGAATIPPPSKKTKALAVRRISFRSNKKKVKVGSPITLSGTLRATKKRRSCQRKQKVAIQRLALPSTFWATIDVAMTNKKGKFRATATPAPANTSFYYRARVNRTKRCAAAKSNRVKVRATN